MILTRIREERGKISLLPRWVHQAYAFTVGYFWLPCPLCGRATGGHEWRQAGGKKDSIPTGKPGISHGICPVCTYEGKADEASSVRADLLPRPVSEHCRPGRCLALTCCSYECSQGRCPSIPEEFRTSSP